MHTPTPLELTATTLTKTDQSLLRRTMRFLVNILEPGLADRARREGYTRQEHALGWQRWRTAAGETRPFEHWLREQQLVEGIDLDSEEQRRRLQEIDEFENTWFPRTRAIIRRVVSKERRDAFAAAFFKDLAQQPLGPAVVGSVGTYLTRLAGLEASTDPDAKAVRATLRSRGLTEGKLATIARLIEETKARANDGKEPSTPVSAADLEKARLTQNGLAVAPRGRSFIFVPAPDARRATSLRSADPRPILCAARPRADDVRETVAVDVDDADIAAEEHVVGAGLAPSTTRQRVVGKRPPIAPRYHGNAG